MLDIFAVPVPLGPVVVEGNGEIDGGKGRMDKMEEVVSGADEDADCEGSVPEEPPAKLDNCAKPTDGGLDRKTE